MGEIVNLRRVRKRRAREEQAGIAAENRARHGRSRVERRRRDAETEKLRIHLDGHKRTDEPEDDTP